MLQMFGGLKSKVDFSYAEKSKAEKNKTKDQEKLAKIAAKRRAEENGAAENLTVFAVNKIYNQEPVISQAINKESKPLFPKTKSYIPEKKNPEHKSSTYKEQNSEKAAAKDKVRLAKIMAARRAACDEDKPAFHQSENEDDDISMQEPLAYKMKRDFRSSLASTPHSFLPPQSNTSPLNRARPHSRSTTPNKRESSVRPVTPNNKNPVRSVPKSSEKDREKLSQILSYRRAVADGEHPKPEIDIEDAGERLIYKPRKSAAPWMPPRKQEDDTTASVDTHSRRPSFADAVVLKKVEPSEEKHFATHDRGSSLFGPELLRPRGPPRKAPTVAEKYSSLSYKVAPGDKEKLASILAGRQKIIEDYEAKSSSQTHYGQEGDRAPHALHAAEPFSWNVEIISKPEPVGWIGTKADVMPRQKAEELSTDEETASATGSDDCSNEAVVFQLSADGATEGDQESASPVHNCEQIEPVNAVSEIEHARNVLDSLKEARLQLVSGAGLQGVDESPAKALSKYSKTKAGSGVASMSPSREAHVPASSSMSQPQPQSSTTEENSKAAQRARALADALCKLSKLRQSRSSSEKDDENKNGDVADVATVAQVKTVAVSRSAANEKAAKYAKLVAEAKEKVLQNRRARSGQTGLETGPSETVSKTTVSPSNEPLETVSQLNAKTTPSAVKISASKQHETCAGSQSQRHHSAAMELYSSSSSSSSASDQSDEITACPAEQPQMPYACHKEQRAGPVSDESMHVSQDSHRKFVNAEHEQVEKNMERWERLKKKRVLKDTEGQQSSRHLPGDQQSSSRYEASVEHEVWMANTKAPNFKAKLGFWNGLFACGSV